MSALRESILRAALELMTQGIGAITIEAVAAAIDRPAEEVRGEVATDSDLKLLAVMDVCARPIPGVVAAVELASTPEDVVRGFLEQFVGVYGADMQHFRALFLDQLKVEMAFSKEQLAQLYPINDAMFGPVAAKLSAHWGTDHLLHGIHPRRLVFAGYLGAMGLLAMKSIAENSDDPLMHTDAELVAELSGALAAPTTMMNQLVALNEASARLAELRTEADVISRVPELLTELLGFRVGELKLGATTVPDSPDAIVVAVMHGDERLGSLVVTLEGEHRIDRRDTARLEMFGNMVGLALDNARFYESLNTLVDQRTSELRDAQAALVQSEKMASMGQLVAGVAHELNTPLGAVQSAQDSLGTAVERIEHVLRTEVPDLLNDNRKLRNALRVAQGSASVVETGCERIGATVDRLERFAQLDRAERAHVDVRQCIDDAVAAMPPPRAAIHIERDYGESTDTTCWPAKLNQLFLIILVNAADAMPDGGEIRIVTRHAQGEIHVTVEDTGTGIQPEHLAKVFDPGFTTKGVGVGTGLGLSIAYQIAKEHGGAVSAESTLGRGTSMHVRLPVAS